MADPVEAVCQLYRTFGEEVGSLHARRMRSFLADRPADAFGRHRYDPDDFGWTYSGLAAEYGDYIERYQIETRRGPLDLAPGTSSSAPARLAGCPQTFRHAGLLVCTRKQEPVLLFRVSGRRIREGSCLH